MNPLEVWHSSDISEVDDISNLHSWRNEELANFRQCLLSFSPHVLPSAV